MGKGVGDLKKKSKLVNMRPPGFINYLYMKFYMHEQVYTNEFNTKQDKY